MTIPRDAKALVRKYFIRFDKNQEVRNMGRVRQRVSESEYLVEFFCPLTDSVLELVPSAGMADERWRFYATAKACHEAELDAVVNSRKRLMREEGRPFDRQKEYDYLRRCAKAMASC
jgi:hypothetical protein